MPADLYPTTQPPDLTYPARATRNNASGTDIELLDRMKVREICEGWGCYRDAAEWRNYRSMVGGRREWQLSKESRARC